MKSLPTLVFGLTVASYCVGVIGVQPAAMAWAGQAAEHDHSHGAGAPPNAAIPATAAADPKQMSQMQQDMMARMAVLDDQLKTLGVEMNTAATVDAKLAAITKALNVLIEQRSIMRMQMKAQATMMEQMMSMHDKMPRMMSAPADGSTTPPR